MQDGARHLFAALDPVDAIHQYFRLDDRHQSLFLTQSRVSRESMRIGADASRARHSVTNADHGSPLREAGAETAIFCQSIAQPVEPLGYGLSGTSSQRPGADIDLDARHDPLPR